MANFFLKIQNDLGHIQTPKEGNYQLLTNGDLFLRNAMWPFTSLSDYRWAVTIKPFPGHELRATVKKNFEKRVVRIPIDNTQSFDLSLFKLGYHQRSFCSTFCISRIPGYLWCVRVKDVNVKGSCWGGNAKECWRSTELLQKNTLCCSKRWILNIQIIRFGWIL